jgi:hypothetical protein
LILLCIYSGFKGDRSQRLSQISAVDPNIEEYWFFCRDWLDKKHGTVRELLPTDEQGNVLSDRNGKIQILFVIFF